MIWEIREQGVEFGDRSRGGGGGGGGSETVVITSDLDAAVLFFFGQQDCRALCVLVLVGF